MKLNFKELAKVKELVKLVTPVLASTLRPEVVKSEAAESEKKAFEKPVRDFKPMGPPSTFKAPDPILK